MQYDDWKLETDRDYDERMSLRSQWPLPADVGGVCGCGASTLRSMAGIGWQCHACAARAFHQLFNRAIRKQAS